MSGLNVEQRVEPCVKSSLLATIQQDLCLLSHFVAWYLDSGAIQLPILLLHHLSKVFREAYQIPREQAPRLSLSSEIQCFLVELEQLGDPCSTAPSKPCLV